MKIFNKQIFNEQFYRNLAIVALGISFYFLVLNFQVIMTKFWWIFSILQPFLIGFALAFLLSGMVNFFEKKAGMFLKIKDQKKRRYWSVFLTMLITFGVVIILLWLLLPQLMRSIAMISTRVPEYSRNLEAFWLGFFPDISIESLEISKKLSQIMNDELPKILAYSGQLVSMFLNFFIGIIIAIYFLYNKEGYIKQIGKIASHFLSIELLREVRAIVKYGNDTFTNFFYGKLLDSLIVAIICFIGMLILGMPYALLVSVIIGITNIVPFFGPFIGAIPTTLLILAVDPVQALWFVIFILVLQQFDGNILGPKILGNSIGLSPIWVLFAIVIGGGLFGLAGMILGIPIFAMIYKLTREKMNATNSVAKSAN